MGFELEKLYSRRKDIHEKFGGQQQGGISTPANLPYIFLFTSEAGEQHGYHDGYDENGLFIYTGEGQVGPMKFLRGNRAVRDHIKDGKELLLFSSTKKSTINRFKGTFVCAGWRPKMGPDRNGNPRELIQFHLTPSSALAAHLQDESSEIVLPENISLYEMRERAYAVVENKVSTAPVVSQKNVYKRSQDVKAYVLARSKGICESCGKAAPFLNKDGKSYLEAHHIRQLSDDGLDIPSWMAAICPNCHREIHHGQDGAMKNQILQAQIRSFENSLVS
ncbi:HNH endonuclease [Collimonas pratensis]|uniref:HNH endonuclease n=1 Tax=Collimonas pratensis TaxID=279113 RepID=UPI00143D8552|nr:HNH endonuclease [Collimonas pratensis]